RAAVGPAGNAVVVWTEDGVVRAASRPAGGAWSAPATLSPVGVLPRVGLDAAGSAIAVWRRPFFTVDPDTGAVTSRSRIEAATPPTRARRAPQTARRAA